MVFYEYKEVNFVEDLFFTWLVFFYYGVDNATEFQEMSDFVILTLVLLKICLCW